MLEPDTQEADLLNDENVEDTDTIREKKDSSMLGYWYTTILRKRQRELKWKATLIDPKGPANPDGNTAEAV